MTYSPLVIKKTTFVMQLGRKLLKLCMHQITIFPFEQIDFIHLKHYNNKVIKILHLVDFCKDMWWSLRDPFCKKELAKNIGGPGACVGKKKSGDAAPSEAEQIDSWQYYEKMSFLWPYLYVRE